MTRPGSRHKPLKDLSKASVFKFWPQLLLAVLAIIAFANAFQARDFIRDDRYIVQENPLLQSWHSLPTLLKTGYWEGATGAEAPVQEYRPLLMVSYLLTARTMGLTPWTYHVFNILLHVANVLLIFLLLKRRFAPPVALAAAALFAVLPVHVESISYITGRSELLVTLFILLTWLELDRARPRIWLVFTLFSGALLSKEQAVLFPAVLVLDDWVVDKRDDSPPALARRYLPLLVAAAIYMGLRAAALSRSFHGGHDYFTGSSYVVRVLTMARFAWLHYAIPSITGLGLQSEFVRPFFQDSSATDVMGWLAVIGWLLLGAIASVSLLRKRAAWAFWMLSGFIWLLPVSNLIIRLDTIGAERFLYLPSIGLCAISAALLYRLSASRRLNAAILCVVVVWFTGLTLRRNRVWRSMSDYYETVVRDNPLSARAFSGLGVAMIESGRAAEAETALERALDLDPDNITAYYNLARLRFQKEDWPGAERYVRECLRRDPASADAWILLAVIEEKRGHLSSAMIDLREATDLQPWNFVARFNLGRLLAAQGHTGEAREEFEKYLELAPDDAQADEVRALLSRWSETPIH